MLFTFAENIFYENPEPPEHCDAGEMISELTLAITNKLPMKALAETVHCYPEQRPQARARVAAG
jgi:hypothetical protein